MGTISKYDYKWIQNISNEYKKGINKEKKENNNSNSIYYPYYINNSNTNNKVERIPWDNLSSSYVRDNISISFDSIMDNSNNSEQVIKEVLRYLYEYGIVLIRDTPIDDKGQGISAFASCISGGAIQNNTMSNYYKYY